MDKYWLETRPAAQRFHALGHRGLLFSRGYPYRVVVTKAVEESVDAQDRVVTKVTLTPILPKPAMKEVLKGVLEKIGG